MRLTLALIIGLLLCLFWPNAVVYPQHSVCGNGICESGEDCENCAQDCGICFSPVDDDDSDDDTGNDDTGDDDTPTTIESQLEREQLKIKRTSEFSIKGGAIDNLRILWP
jgi:hypothetical protein